MIITKAHFEHLARLARFEIKEDEKEKYAEQISAILDYFKELNELDTEGVEPMAHVFDLQNVTRPDVVNENFSADKVLAEAPVLEKKQIKVSGVFENK
jgi:aspartyl-tRNA(Asn)/glutamyl-tRNA(Gln) amidotransferase subunit C